MKLRRINSSICEMRSWPAWPFPPASHSLQGRTQPFFLRTTGAPLTGPSPRLHDQRRWLSTGDVAKKSKPSDKRPSKRSNFDAGRKPPVQGKKVHILEARDRVLSRVRDKKRDMAESKAKITKKDEGKHKDKKKSAKPKERDESAASGVVEVVGDGAPVVQPRRVASIAVRDVEPPEAEARTALPPMTLDDVVSILREEKGLNLMVLDVSEKCNFAHYMVILEGRSGRHLRSMAERIMEEMKQRQLNPEANVGLDVSRDNDDWIMVDTGDILVQLFSPGARRYYDLEGLWILQPRMSEREGHEVVEVEDLDPLADLDDVPGGWNPWDQTVQK